MRYATVTVLAVLCVAFWGLVFWAADAFDPLEFAAIIVGGLVFLGIWLWWEVRHALEDPTDDDDLVYHPADWEWPADDVSEVRHGGLGR